MDYVWIYVYGDSAWRKIGIFNELEYSIKSVKKYGPPGRCFVVGDKPDLDDVIHIPVERFTDPNPDKQAHLDKVRKMNAIVNHPDISEEFVLMYDDIFLLQKTPKEDLQINWAKCEVTNFDEYLNSNLRTGTIGYKRSWRSTYEFVFMLRSGQGKKTYDWETHTPRYFKKSLFKNMLDTYDFETLEMLPQAIYDGLYADNTQIINSDIQSDLWSHKPFMDFSKEFAKNYMNIYDNVIVPEFVEQMKAKFG